MFIKVSTHPLISPYEAFCMADTNYKINEIFFNSNTVYAFFVFMLVSSIAKNVTIMERTTRLALIIFHYQRFCVTLVSVNK